MQDTRETTVTKADVLWNMLGSGFAAVASAVLLLGVTRLSGAENGGLFSVAFAAAQMLMMLGNYGMRTYQSSDLHGQYSFYVYFVSRIITCSLMVFCGFLWCHIQEYQAEKTAIFMMVVASRAIEALADIFEGRLHQTNHLAIAGKSQAIRTLCYSLGFIVVLRLTGLLPAACMAMIFVQLMCISLYTIAMQRRLCPCTKRSPLRSVLTLLRTCFPLCASAFMLMYIVNSPKYAIDSLLEAEAQAYYSILYLPVQIITLFSTFVFKPMTSSLAQKWEDGNVCRFISMIIHAGGVVLIVTLLCTGVAALVGIPALSYITNLDFSPYYSTLLIIMLGGGFSAAVNLLTQALTIMRCQSAVLMCYAVITVVSLLLPRVLVRLGGIMYAGYSFLILMVLLCVLQGITLYAYQKKQREVLK